MFSECTNLVLEVLDCICCMEVDVTQPLVSPSLLLVYVAITKWLMLQQNYVVNKLGYVPQVRDEYARLVWNTTFRKTYARSTALQIRSSTCKSSSFWVHEQWVGDALDSEEVVLVKTPKVIKSNVGLGVGCFEWVHDKHVNAGKSKGKEKDLHIGKAGRDLLFKGKDRKDWNRVTQRVPKRYHTLRGHGFGTFIMDNIRGHLKDLLQEVSLPVCECSPCVSSIVLKPEFHKPFLLPLSFTRQAFRYHLKQGEGGGSVEGSEGTVSVRE